MTLTDLGSLGEFVSTVAVVLSLIYVAHEIRENSRSTRLAALQSHLHSAQRFLELSATDRDLARVVRIGQATPEASTEDEFRQFAAWVAVGMRAAENLFIQHQAGNIDGESWTARSTAFLHLLSTPGGAQVWGEIAKAHRQDFQEWLAPLAVREDSPALSH
jgi:hypothetical protein